MRTIEDLDTITDGCTYYLEDFVNADPNGCDNCHACCLGVSDYVAINPFDFYQMLKGSRKTFEVLMADNLICVEEQKLSLPFLKTHGEEEHCSFLNSEGRCSIHSTRPDICRLFPLARVYDTDGFHYTLQVNACIKPELDSVMVQSHIQIKLPKEYTAFIWSWYLVIKALRFRLKFVRGEEDLKAVQELFWTSFYASEKLNTAPTPKAFFEIYFKELPAIKNSLGIL